LAVPPAPPPPPPGPPPPPPPPPPSPPPAQLRDALRDRRTGLWDLSKVPDVYDAAKHDAVHNRHLLRSGALAEVFGLSRSLARAVVPSEYGVTPLQKLRVGSRVAETLLGKLLVDLENSRRESRAAAEAEGSLEGWGDFAGLGRGEGAVGVGAGREGVGGGADPQWWEANEPPPRDLGAGHAPQELSQAPPAGAGAAGAGGASGPSAGGADSAPPAAPIPAAPAPQEQEKRPRVTFSPDGVAPLRHVRSRIYFTAGPRLGEGGGFGLSVSCRWLFFSPSLCVPISPISHSLPLSAAPSPPPPPSVCVCASLRLE